MTDAIKIDEDAAEEQIQKATLTESQRNRMLQLRSRAEAANQKNNFGWAAELYWQIYILDRATLTEYLQKMILSSIAQATVAPNAQIYQIKAYLTHWKLYLQALRMKYSQNNASDYFELYENLFKANPDGPFAPIRLARAYEKHGLTHNAAMILEVYLRSRKGRVEVLRKMGDLFLEAGLTDKARDTFKKILAVKPLDQAADKRLKDVMAQTTVDEAKLRGSGLSGSIKDSEEFRREQVEMKVNKTDDEYTFLIQNKIQEIEGNPTNISLRNELLTLYKNKGDKAKVLETLESISEFVTGDIGLQLEKLNAEIDLLQETHSDLPPKELQQKIALHQRAVYEKLIKQFPTSVDLHYYQGQVLFDLMENDEALRCFQVTEKIPDYQAQSNNYKGQIFLRKKMHDMALDEFQGGIALLPKMNAIKKELIYNLGLTYESMGSKKEALAAYKQIFKEDVGFRDIRDRIEVSYQENPKADSADS